MYSSKVVQGWVPFHPQATCPENMARVLKVLVFFWVAKISQNAMEKMKSNKEKNVGKKRKNIAGIQLHFMQF
jgi:hypothetical protein